VQAPDLSGDAHLVHLQDACGPRLSHGRGRRGPLRPTPPDPNVGGIGASIEITDLVLFRRKQLLCLGIIGYLPGVSN
jgi:hypothetical protein